MLLFFLHFHIFAHTNINSDDAAFADQRSDIFNCIFVQARNIYRLIVLTGDIIQIRIIFARVAHVQFNVICVDTYRGPVTFFSKRK
jgi:hypothetical protein